MASTYDMKGTQFFLIHSVHVDRSIRFCQPALFYERYSYSRKSSIELNKHVRVEIVILLELLQITPQSA